MSLKDDWVKRAECAKQKYALEHDFTDWFSEDYIAQQQAKSICNQVCPVQFECAQHALFNKEQYGVWGGMDEFRVRSALSLDEFGHTRIRTKPLVCPNCLSRDVIVAKKREKLGYHTQCSKCKIEWHVHKSPEKTERALARKEKRRNAAME